MSNVEWGAIPRQLAEDVSLTLKKKFNVQTGFKPVEWNKNIKGLTPLPEKTVSGSIVTFSDGADDVPLKSCAVTIAPTLDGVSSVDVVQTGKNFIDFVNHVNTGTSVGMTFSATADGGISYSGTATGTFGYATAVFDFTIKSGQTFTFSRNTAFNYIHRIRLVFSDDTTANVSIYANNTSVTYTPEKDVKAVRLLLAGLTVNTYYNDTVYIQTEYGSTPTSFEPFDSETYTANLGRTIYGGSVDVVNGTGTDENGNDFTFTPVPINSRLGDNTMWSDGDLSVIYRYVAGDPSFETVLSSNPLLELTGVSGTDVERTLWTYTATDHCKIKFHSNTQVRTNTGSNDGYFTVKKNDTVILTTYADTSTTTQFPIPDIELESGDTVTITGGFDNYHTSCWFDVYSTITILHVDN